MTDSRTVTITADDLFGLLTKAADYGTRFPHGIIPPHLWQLLDADQQERLHDFLTEVNAMRGQPTLPVDSREAVAAALARRAPEIVNAGPDARDRQVAMDCAVNDVLGSLVPSLNAFADAVRAQGRTSR